MEPLNEARIHCSATSFSSKVYYTGDLLKSNTYDAMVNPGSIDYMDVAVSSQWQIISLSVIKVLTYPAICAINHKEVIIMGGIDKKKNHIRDIVIVDTESKTARVALQFKWEFSCSSTTLRESNDTIVSLVICSGENKR